MTRVDSTLDSSHPLLHALNTEQRQAVTAPLQPLMILAGAGSGKTRALIHRIAWLIQMHHVGPDQILAVTFTNKAAAEMRHRLETVLNQSSRTFWVGTFHGLSHRILRTHAGAAGLPDHFQVIDSNEQLRIIKQLQRNLNLPEELLVEPAKIQNFINRKKDESIRASTLVQPSGEVYTGIIDPQEQQKIQIYQQYEQLCFNQHLVDFSELLLRTYELLNNHTELLTYYQNKFQHFLVDEFQDTNTIQYQWLKLLARNYKSITIVGDDDQSIYGWRGAKIENMHQFSEDYPNTLCIRLEQNYRSTPEILQAANCLIDQNKNRLPKTLWTAQTTNPEERIKIYGALNEEDEAKFIAQQIRSWLEQNKNHQYSDITILYRSNALSRSLEDVFTRLKIPYAIYGGVRFFERAEIKDALAYLRLIRNVHDTQAFERVVNLPTRGIGKRTLEKLSEHAEALSVSLWTAMNDLLAQELITGKAANGFENFQMVISQLQHVLQQFPDQSFGEFIAQVLIQTGLLEYYRLQPGELAKTKLENLQELISAAQDFESDTNFAKPDQTVDPNPLLTQIDIFLAHTALNAGDNLMPVNPASLDPSDLKNNQVHLMTIHAAKGLEFPFVIVCGVEEGIFPSYYAQEKNHTLEEERRLCYVAMTRAMKRLIFTYATRRRLYGREDRKKLSRFLKEIPAHLIEMHEKQVQISSAYRSRFSIVAKTHPSETQKSEESAELAGGFRLGQRVKHPIFGTGVVLDTEGQGDRTKFRINFDHTGVKWLVLLYAELAPA